MMRVLIAMVLLALPLAGEPMPTEGVPPSPALMKHLESLVPQVAISGGGLSGVEVSASTAEQAVESVDCESLCATIWAIAKVEQPFEIPASDDRIKVGDACRCLSGPGPRILRRGAQ